jgi:predicted RNase H-like nuclease
MRYNSRMAVTRFLGVDLAWREGRADLGANETGVAVIDAKGQILDADWTCGVEQTIAWADSVAGDGDALMFHPVAKKLAEEPSPVTDVAYKHREDLIDALVCAWTASLWTRYGLDRCQVLGLPADPNRGPAATIIAPARPEQRGRTLN